LFFGLSGLIIITFLLETSRAPFDLPEAESELVTGYTTEYGGFFFGLYYLGEYLHLFFFSLIISIIFFGGWELPNFLLNFYNYYYNIFYIL
jgi:NADH-quinone oxidoreductase subunit H